MVLPGILRRVNKTLPALLQTIAIICFIHYIAKGVLVKTHMKMTHQDYHFRTKAGSPHAHAGRAAKLNAGTRHSSSSPHSTAASSSSTSTTTATASTTTPMPTFPDEVIEQEQQRRLDTLHQACTRMNMGLWKNGEESNFTKEESLTIAAVPKIPLYQALLVSEKKKLAVCPVVRAGTQWLSRRLLHLTGKFSKTQLYRLHEPPSAIVRHHYAYLSSWEKYPVVLAQCVTILMGRHPLDRLLASYRHVLEDPDKNPHGYLHYGKRIVRAYRKAPTPSKGPTFEEFVRFLLEHDSHHLDEAWQPTIRRCTPCHIPYNVVVHYETLWHDIQWAWKKAGLVSLNTTDYFVQTITPQIRREYFSQLTLAQIISLYKKFKLDFEIYGYSLEEHIAYAQPGDEAIDPAIMNNLPRNNPDLLQKYMKEEEEKTLKEDKDGDELQLPLESSFTGGKGPEEIADNFLIPSADD
ncbi:carbohydrate sulfotransferase 10-like [Portunus trituberculatus]|nr:carbohydrate sulfotransferase 10-like [Portunus trituberculatus]